MSSTPSLSVLIPTCQRAEMLAHCLQSVLECRVNVSEVIVGDDSGDSETAQVCRSFLKRLPIVHLVPNGKGSLAANLTRLLKAASGEWILLIHDDDFLSGDHSAFPAIFDGACDFFFTDHWVANEYGHPEEIASDQNSLHYGRTFLREGIQDNVFDLAIRQRVCLDGFYVRRSSFHQIMPDSAFGNVADYFWVFRLLTSGIRVAYSKERTFVYRNSINGLTSKGIDANRLLCGFQKLRQDDFANRSAYDEKISQFTWYAVNQCVRNSEHKRAWKHLRAIKFHYRHSVKHQALLPVQVLWIVFSKGLSKWLSRKRRTHKFTIHSVL